MTDKTMTLEELRARVTHRWPDYEAVPDVTECIDAAIRERDELCKVRDYFELNAPPTPEQWHEMCARAEQAESALAALRKRVADGVHADAQDVAAGVVAIPVEWDAVVLMEDDDAVQP